MKLPPIDKILHQGRLAVIIQDIADPCFQFRLGPDHRIRGYAFTAMLMHRLDNSRETVPTIRKRPVKQGAIGVWGFCTRFKIALTRCLSLANSSAADPAPVKVSPNCSRFRATSDSLYGRPGTLSHQLNTK